MDHFAVGLTRPPHARPEITEAWKRSRSFGLVPEAWRPEPQISNVDRNSRLLRLAAPVLDRLQGSVAGSPLVFGLADGRGRIVDSRRAGPTPIDHPLRAIGAVPGAVMTENTIGANAIGTALEIRSGIAVAGDEHFLAPARTLACYGQPIFDPATRRVAGVLALSAPLEAYSPLFRPVLEQAALEIESRLLDHARAADTQLHELFRRIVARSAHPVIGLNSDIVLASTAAQREVSPDAYERLRHLPAVAAGGAQTVPLDGWECFGAVRIHPIPRGEGAVFELIRHRTTRTTREDEADHRSGPPRGMLAQLDADLTTARARRLNVLLTGERGCGATRALRLLARDADHVAVFDLVDMAAEGEPEWLRRFGAAVSSGIMVTVEHLELAPRPVARFVAAQLGQADTRWAISVAETSAPDEFRRISQAAIPLPTVQACRTDIPGVIATMSAELSEYGATYLTPDAVAALSDQHYPGNFVELRTTLACALRRRRGGPITRADLMIPPLATSAPRGLTRIEQLEYDAITDALRRTDGNRVHAARELGISRSTLQRRLKAYRIQP
ncbi:sigma-54-dependent Fis family transcriptional regulator [Rhodococcus opacus]|uniref:sigma-54-dependent Fis family transcriptional regulator n=1 Tax=Rhodococcus opacus TaxID=37919 RepID=UPI001C493C34|nr:helix-turn-helix domain-containing protein [Rhodococcus opacus]MBV6754880.1 hypothetical protein [Rhodococcus opacus]